MEQDFEMAPIDQAGMTIKSSSGYPRKRNIEGLRGLLSLDATFGKKREKLDAKRMTSRTGVVIS
jgi:hypothetical protein